jgi:hypothetical protein
MWTKGEGKLSHLPIAEECLTDKFAVAIMFSTSVRKYSVRTQKLAHDPTAVFFYFSVSYMLMSRHYFEVGHVHLLQNSCFHIIHGHTPCYSVLHDYRETETTPLNTIIRNVWTTFFSWKACPLSYCSRPIRPSNKSQCLPLFWRDTNTSVKIANPWFKSRVLHSRRADWLAAQNSISRSYSDEKPQGKGVGCKITV